MKYADFIAVAAEIAKNPPHFGVDTKREAALYQLDALFSEADSETMPAVGRYYRHRFDATLAEVSAYRGKTPRLWKVYSSGFIIRDGKRIIGLDINNGCTPPTGRTTIKLKRSQVKALANLLTEYYVTHSHEDHISVELCDDLAKQGKLIVMPAECIRRWMVKNGTPAENFATFGCRTFMKWQGTAEKGLDCAMYLFALSNGKTVFSRGDIFHKEGFEECMEQIRNWQAHIDYALVSHYSTGGGTPPLETLDKEHKCRFVPSHEWEFSHRRFGLTGSGNTQSYAILFHEFAKPYQAGRAQCLSWGECIDLD